MMILVTGGSGSGKSAFAEDCVYPAEKIKEFISQPCTLLTKKAKSGWRGTGKCAQEKVLKQWSVLFGLKNLKVSHGSTVLLECMSNLTANEIFREDGAGEKTEEEILEGVRRLKEQAGNLIIVTNEIFSDSIFYEKETQNYQRILGAVNQKLAQMADSVVEVVYGIPIYYKKGDRSYEKSLE